MNVDVECEARWMLERAGFTTYDAPGAHAIVTGLLGPDSIRSVSGRYLRGAHGQLARVYGRDIVYVSRALPAARAAYTALHEMGHWRLRQLGYTGPDVEAICDAIAVSLLAPHDAFRLASEEHGPAWEQLAFDFAVSQTIAALRYGEVRGTTVAVVDGAKVRIRGDSCRGPDTETGWRSLAKAPVLPFVSSRLTDNRRRVAVAAVAV